MANDEETGDGETDLMAEIIEDTNTIAHETKSLMMEAKSSFSILICCLLFMSILSILLSTWLAKTITHSPTSFGSIVIRYFGFDRNETEPYLTWWTPVNLKLSELAALNTSDQSTKIILPLKAPSSAYPNFHAIVLPLLFICSIVLAGLAYYARVKCTRRDFAWGAVPKIPLDRVDELTAIKTIAKDKQAEPDVDYTIVQGTTDEPVVFALAEKEVEPVREEGDIIDEGTQYESDDLLRVITHVASAPQLHAEVIPSLTEQQHMMELLQREPLPTLSPSK